MSTRVHHAAAFAALFLSGCATPGQPPAKPDNVAANAACLTQTGSRIASDCTAIGRSYSSTDISATGATSAGDALRLLDPSVTISR